MISQRHKDAALKFLAPRRRTEQEMRLHLEKLDLALEDIEALVAWLYSYGYLDDAEYAAAYIRDKLRFHPCGSLRLRQELRDKGVDEATLQAALAANLPVDLEKRFVKHFYLKARKRGRTHVQALRYVAGKGFPGDLIRGLEEFL
ncbi:regulatory protein RecX [Peptococcus simiae]|uniref:regulatory protein RecX n=1 Tax=Peptococcus simiae TaxID=1643805 RepID=UPI00397EE7AD